LLAHCAASTAIAMNECPFCKLVRDRLPAHAIYENERLFVMLDRQSLCFGHVMVIPKAHTAKVYEMGDDEYTTLLLFTKRLAIRIQQALRPKAVAYVAHGAGLPHVHLHLVPLTENDEVSDPQKFLRHLSDEELVAEARRLKELIGVSWC
jgi:histidine triad (HIT) family protein